MYTLGQYKKLFQTKGNLIRTVPNIFVSKFQSFNSERLGYYPYWIQIEPTNKCNLKCKMCARTSLKSFGHMSLDDFKKTINKFPHIFGITLQGNGEPFLNPEIFEMIKYAKNKKIIVVTVSNGTLLTENIIEKIIQSELDSISISIDAADKKSYEKIRRGSNFSNLSKNVKSLVEARNKHRSNLSIYMVSVRTDDNIKNVGKFEGLAKELGVDKLLWQDITTTSDYPDYTREHRVKNPTKFRKCFWPWSRMYINWNGDVAPCCSVVQEKMGNILKEDMKKIWNSDKYVSFRKTFIDGKIPKVCIGCSYLTG